MAFLTGSHDHGGPSGRGFKNTLLTSATAIVSITLIFAAYTIWYPYAHRRLVHTLEGRDLDGPRGRGISPHEAERLLDTALVNHYGGIIMLRRVGDGSSFSVALVPYYAICLTT